MLDLKFCSRHAIQISKAVKQVLGNGDVYGSRMSHVLLVDGSHRNPSIQQAPIWGTVDDRTKSTHSGGDIFIDRARARTLGIELRAGLVNARQSSAKCFRHGRRRND